MHRQIDIAAINRDDFNVTEENGLILITPQKHKHVWKEEELHLRSLLCRPDGEVVSAGWPKFANYGENAQHDVEFKAALDRKAVVFREKMDGTLIIMSYVDGKVHFRTRGNHDLGDFADEVMWLISTKYPKLIPWFAAGATDLGYTTTMRDNYSLLFEYVGPDNKIVLDYKEPKLVLLGAVNKRAIEPLWERYTLEWISASTGVPLAGEMSFFVQDETIVDAVRAWKGREGVVASFVGTTDGISINYRMLKIKSAEYIKLHSLKFRLAGKVGQLCFLLGVKKREDAPARLYQFGVDYEAQQFIAAEIEAYFDNAEWLDVLWDHYAKIVSFYRDNALVRTDDPKEQRKLFVLNVQKWLRGHVDYENPAWFGVAMNLFDGDQHSASVSVIARILLDLPVQTVRTLLTDPADALRVMLHVPVPEAD